MSYLEELLPEFKKGAKIRRKDWRDGKYIKLSGVYAKDEYGDVYFIEPNEITADDWELYEEPMGREITKKRRFSVYLNATADVSATITVNADNKEEAKKLAIDKVSTCDWDVDDVATSFIEVVYIGEEQDED